MKAILVFDLPEDNEEYRIYYNAMNTHCAIEEIFQLLRNELKHNYELTAEQKETIHGLRDKFIEIIEDNEAIMS